MSRLCTDKGVAEEEVETSVKEVGTGEGSLSLRLLLFELATEFVFAVFCSSAMGETALEEDATEEALEDSDMGWALEKDEVPELLPEVVAEAETPPPPDAADVVDPAGEGVWERSISSTSDGEEDPVEAVATVVVLASSVSGACGTGGAAGAIWTGTDRSMAVLVGLPVRDDAPSGSLRADPARLVLLLLTLARNRQILLTSRLLRRPRALGVLGRRGGTKGEGQEWPASAAEVIEVTVTARDRLTPTRRKLQTFSFLFPVFFLSFVFSFSFSFLPSLLFLQESRPAKSVTCASPTRKTKKEEKSSCTT